MTKKKHFSLLTILVATLLLPVLAHADTINFVITNATQTGTSGGTLTFNATVAAPSANSGDVSLDSDTFTVAGPFILDDIDFITGFPLSLAPDTSFAEPLFTLNIPLAIAPNLYTGSSFQILFSDVAGLQGSVSQDFSVRIPGTSPVPEPGSWVLLLTGIGALATTVFIRRRAIGLAI